MAGTLWTPWRMEYIVGPKPDGCVFCTAVEQGRKSHAENLVLYTAENSFVMMNRFPYTHAHLMILPKKHISKLDDLTKEECTELFDLVVKAQSALIRAINPQGLNMGLNQGEAAGAGIKDHLHIHIVPRWNGDTNFMPMLAETRTMPEHLTETYRTLRGHFDAIDDSK